MKKIYKALDIVYNKITKEDYDTVWLVTGDEGTGKSNLLLAIVEYWYNKLNGECLESDIKHVSLDRLNFVTDLKDAKRYELSTDDEAGDISSKRAMSEFNVLLTQAYQVIRGDNLFTILVLPSPFDIDGFFVKRRARGLININNRGKCKFYSKTRLRNMIALNQSRYIKKVEVVKATFCDVFPKYKGILLKEYKKKKAEKMQEVRNQLYEKVMKLDTGVSNNSNASKLSRYPDTISTKIIAEIEGVSERTIQRWKRKATTT